jgi:myxalamid-type polyketide synthase MxaB
MKISEPHGADPAPEAARPRSNSVTDFAPYQNLQRRFADIGKNVGEMTFFEPRDGINGSMIRWRGQELVNYSGYNYLGLCGNAEISQAAKAAIDKYGTSVSASRIVSGQIDLHGLLEREIASFLGTEDAITFVSGYLTNVTVISHLLAKTDAVIFDRDSHNSIMTGARLSGAKMITYPGGDWDGLDQILTAKRDTFRRGLLVCEGVYSMDGNIVDLKRAAEIKEKHNLILMVDEAHSVGTIGATGRGICEWSGLPPSTIDIHMGTLSKALASAGGYVAGDRGLIEYLRYLAPGFIFSVGLSPADTAAALTALKVLRREPSRLAELRERTQLFHTLAKEAGLTFRGDEGAPIASLIVGDGNACMLLSQRLLSEGIYVQPIVYPAVGLKSARLRFFITRDHTEEQFRATMPILARELKLLPAIGQ